MNSRLFYPDDLKEVKDYLRLGGDSNWTDRNGDSILHHAVMLQDYAMVDLLLRNPLTNVNSQNKLKRTPLHMSVLVNNLEISRALLKCGADIDVADINQETILHIASRKKLKEIVYTVLNSFKSNLNVCDKSHRTPLHWAVIDGHTYIVQLLVRKGSDLNIQDWRGHTPLHFAVLGNRIKTLSYLLKKGADSTIGDAEGTTPLHLAASFKSWAIAAPLVEYTSNLNLQDMMGNTPLMIAIEGNFFEFIKNAINHSTIELTANNDGQSPFHKAAALNLPKIMELLILYAISHKKLSLVDAQDCRLRTPLHIASFNGSIECAIMLLEAGARVNLVDEEGASVLHKAAYNGHTGIIEALIVRQSSIDLQDIHGATPLHKAAFRGHSKAIEILCLVGAQVNILDDQGGNAFHNAAYEGHEEVINILMRYSPSATITAVDIEGYSALHMAAVQGRDNVIPTLVSKGGFDLNSVTKQGWTAVMLAMYKGHISTSLLLISLGAEFTLTKKVKRELRHIPKEALLMVSRCVKYGKDMIQGSLSPGKIKNGFFIANKNSVGNQDISHRNSLCESLNIVYNQESKILNERKSLREPNSANNSCGRKSSKKVEVAKLGLESLKNNQLEKSEFDDLKTRGYRNASIQEFYNKEKHLNNIFVSNNSRIKFDFDTISVERSRSEDIASKTDDIVNYYSDVDTSAGQKNDSLSLPNSPNSLDISESFKKTQCSTYQVRVHPIRDSKNTNDTKLYPLEKFPRTKSPGSIPDNTYDSKFFWDRTNMDQVKLIISSSEVGDVNRRISKKIRELSNDAQEAIRLFSTCPRKSVEKLIELEIIEDNCSSVSSFFFQFPGLDKTQLGLFLSEGKPWNKSILEEFVKHFNFADEEFDVALRKYLSKFRLPGEAQKIDRLMEAFACAYYDQNPNSGIFADSDAVYFLAFSTIMLNTDSHNRAIKKAQKMTKEQWIRNNSSANGGKDFLSDFLSDLYERVCDHEIKMDSDYPKSVEITQRGWLYKQGGRVRAWKKRWFILESYCLLYFENDTDLDPIGIIPLENLILQPIFHPKRRFIFELRNPKPGPIKAICRKKGQMVVGNHDFYVFQASSREDFDRWIETLSVNIFRNPMELLLANKKMQLERSNGKIKKDNQGNSSLISNETIGDGIMRNVPTSNLCNSSETQDSPKK